MVTTSNNAANQFTYKRHQPENTLLYKVFQENLETFLAERKADTDRTPLPPFVEKELRAFTECGILAHGFVILSCESCESDYPVAFSCKRRGFCPSCAAKRMNETTAHLIDNVLPHAPYRQWVVTFPHSLRFWLATSRILTNIVHQITSKIIMSYYVATAEAEGIDSPIAGGMTFVQRAGSALNLHVHFHKIVFDGVFAIVNGRPKFFHLPGPSDEEVGQAIEAIAGSVISMLRKKKYLSEEGVEVDRPDYVDKIFLESEQFTDAIKASQGLMIAFGENAGKKVRRIGKGFGYSQELALIKGPRCASVNGFTCHANREIGEEERDKLEDLISYCARPAFSNQRLSLKDENNPNGDLVYELKSSWPDGTAAIVLSPLEMLEKISALIPPPYSHLTRYYGILSSHSEWRPKILLKPNIKKGFVSSADNNTPEKMTWSKLLKRTYKIDITQCLNCGVKILAKNCTIVTKQPVIKVVLSSLMIEYNPPPLTKARSPPNNPEYDMHPDYETNP